MGKEEDLNQSRGCRGRASVRGAGPGCKQISAQRARPRWLENCIPSCPLQTREAWAVQVLCLLFHASLFTGLGPVLGTAALGVSQRTLQDPVPARLPALAGLTVALGARYRVPATTRKVRPLSSSLALPFPPPSLPPSHSLCSSPFLEPTSYAPATGPLHVLFLLPVSLFRQLLTASAPYLE